jgi:hypothetical protein
MRRLRAVAALVGVASLIGLAASVRFFVVEPQLLASSGGPVGLVVTAVEAMMTVFSVGLLMHWNWARIGMFVVSLVLGIWSFLALAVEILRVVLSSLRAKGLWEGIGATIEVLGGMSVSRAEWFVRFFGPLVLAGVFLLLAAYLQGGAKSVQAMIGGAAKGSAEPSA